MKNRKERMQEMTDSVPKDKFPLTEKIQEKDRDIKDAEPVYQTSWNEIRHSIWKLYNEK